MPCFNLFADDDNNNKRKRNKKYFMTKYFKVFFCTLVLLFGMPYKQKQTSPERVISYGYIIIYRKNKNKSQYISFKFNSRYI